MSRKKSRKHIAHKTSTKSIMHVLNIKAKRQKSTRKTVTVKHAPNTYITVWGIRYNISTEESEKNEDYFKCPAISSPSDSEFDDISYFDADNCVPHDDSSIHLSSSSVSLVADFGLDSDANSDLDSCADADEDEDEYENEDEDEYIYQFLDDTTKSLCLQFAILGDQDRSRDFLHLYPHLVCKSTTKYLLYWCTKINIEDDQVLIKRLAHQVVSIRYMLLWSDPDPIATINNFYGIINHCTESFREKFRHTINKLVVDINAKIRIEQERYTCVHPKDILDSIPFSMCYAMMMQDLSLLREALSQFEPEEGLKHLRNCIRAGLWVLNTQTGLQEYLDMHDDLPESRKRLGFHLCVERNWDFLPITQSSILTDYYFEGQEGIIARDRTEKSLYSTLDVIYDNVLVPCSYTEKTKTLFEIFLKCHRDNPIVFGPVAFKFDVIEYYVPE